MTKEHRHIMLKNPLRLSKPREGFTLIELLVVVIVIAILSAVTVPQYTKMVEKSRMRDAESKLAIMFQAQRVYRLDWSSYATLAQLVPAYMPQPNTAQFSFTVPAPGVATFTARATRLAVAGGKYTNAWIQVNETFNGSNYTYDTVLYLSNGNPS